jgi:hypothetical protein
MRLGTLVRAGRDGTRSILPRSSTQILIVSHANARASIKADEMGTFDTLYDALRRAARSAFDLFLSG